MIVPIVVAAAVAAAVVVVVAAAVVVVVAVAAAAADVVVVVVVAAVAFSPAQVAFALLVDVEVECEAVDVFYVMHGTTVLASIGVRFLCKLCVSKFGK